MAENLDGLADAANLAKTLSGLILVSPQKNVGIQPLDENGFTEGKPILFHTIGEEQVSLESDITDHYVEDNTAINDQIALRPETFTVLGIVGELNNVVPEELKVARLVADRLAVMSAYTPELSVAALKLYNTAEELYNTAQSIKRSAVQSWDSISGKGTINEVGSFGLRDSEPGESQTLQQIYFQQFYGLWRNRTLFTVQTPWAIFNNMAIKSLRVIQDGDNSDSTDLEVTFKMMRFTKSQLSLDLYSENSTSGRSAGQKSGVINMGTQTPTPFTPPTSALA